MSFYTFAKTLCRWYTYLAFRMRYEGLENIPKNQGFILASNHITVMDPLFVAAKIKQPIHFMAKIELFGNPVTKWVLKGLNAFPVNRGKGDGTAITEAGRRIDGGGVLGVFIEGRRSEDGKPQRARNGVALIAGQTGADVLPCAVVYDKKLSFRAPVTVRYGKLIENGRLQLDAEAPATLRLASKTIMADIGRLFWDGSSALPESDGNGGGS